MLQRALTIRTEKLGSQHLAVAQTYNKLGLLYIGRKDYRRAESAFYQTMVIRKKALGTNNLLYADAANNLAIALHLQGLCEEAIQMQKIAYKTTEQILGVEHKLTKRRHQSLLKTQQCKATSG